jgi:hypothetical protein
MFPSSSLATLGFPYVKDNYIFSVYLAAYILVHLMSSHVRNCFHTFYMARGKGTVSILF